MDSNRTLVYFSAEMLYTDGLYQENDQHQPGDEQVHISPVVVIH